jgi:hypothetical protein
MVVARMQRLDVGHLPALEPLGSLEPRHPAPGAIEIGDRPPALVAYHADPFGPQQAQLLRRIAPVGDQLHIGIAVQEQVGRDALEQPVGRDQRHRRLACTCRGTVDGQPAEHPRDQPHRALAHRVPPVHLVELRLVGAREPLLHCI